MICGDVGGLFRPYSFPLSFIFGGGLPLGVYGLGVTYGGPTPWSWGSIISQFLWRLELVIEALTKLNLW